MLKFALKSAGLAGLFICSLAPAGFASDCHFAVNYGYHYGQQVLIPVYPVIHPCPVHATATAKMAPHSVTAPSQSAPGRVQPGTPGFTPNGATAVPNAAPGTGGAPQSGGPSTPAASTVPPVATPPATGPVVSPSVPQTVPPAVAPSGPQPAASDLPPLPTAAAVGTQVEATTKVTSASEAAKSEKPAVKPTELTTGDKITFKSRLLGSSMGQVTIRISDKSIKCEVISWLDNQVVLLVPEVDIETDTAGSLEVSRPDGKTFRKPIVMKSESSEIIVNREPTTKGASGG